MTKPSRGAARAVADVTAGSLLASVEIAVAPERVFRALTTEEVTKWWGSDDLYRVTRWTSELRVGGQWRSEGRGADGHAFAVEGEYLEIDPPRKLVQTWRPNWEQGQVTTITYRLEPTQSGTRVTVRHEGFGERADACRSHGNGWERVLGWLSAFLEPADARRFFLCRLIAPRPSFAFDMTPEERALMAEHGVYWRQRLQQGDVVVFGPVADPAGPWGLGILHVADEAAVQAFQAGDPVMRSGRGFRYETLPLLQAVVPS
ncbi:MAG TPA: SRPBCC domain-containing protein [Polyangiaceae bacterium]|nr:SRPBCC domain-containing protein [Polyangiaceae bacterium]